MSFVIKDLVYEKARFLTEADLPLVESEILQTKYALQPYLDKSDVEVEADTSYTELQKMLIAYYTAYQLTVRRAGDNLTGEGGEVPTLEAPIKKLKADVVETEFSELGGQNRLVLDTNSLLESLKKLVCETAMTLKLRLPLCQSLHKSKNVFVPFKRYS